VKVEVRDVSKRFIGERAALDCVSLTVADGEFVALLGPSGSGKTTLLRVLAGLDFAEAGSILFDGRAMDAVPARDRGVGFVFQNYALFRHMTVARNVAFGLEIRPRNRRPSPAEIRRRAHTLLDLMGIGGLGARYPAQLSGGQRQRVALARALAIEPGLLLLDEPFGALDAQVRKNLRVWLRDLHVRMGLTSVFVTHDQAEAMEMADRVAVLNAGRIHQVDAPERLYTDPTTPFVHEFLGESVRLACTVRAGQARIDSVPSATIPTACPPGPAFALIRPHEIGLLPGPGAARAVGVHTTGPLKRVVLMFAERDVEVLCPLDAWTPGVGDTCGLDLSRARIYPLAAAARGAAPPRGGHGLPAAAMSA